MFSLRGCKAFVALSNHNWITALRLQSSTKNSVKCMMGKKPFVRHDLRGLQ